MTPLNLSASAFAVILLLSFSKRYKIIFIEAFWGVGLGGVTAKCEVCRRTEELK